MLCDEFDTRMHQLLDRRRRPEGDAALLSHAAGCRPCRSLLKTQETLFRGVSLLEPPSPSDDLARRVAARAKPVSRWRRAVPWAIALSTVAAAILLAIIPLRLAGPMPYGRSTVSEGENRPQETGGRSPRGRGTARRDGAAGFAVVSPLRAEKKAEAQRRYQRMMDGMSEQLARLPLDSVSAIDRLPPGLRELAEPFARAIDLVFRNTIYAGRTS